MLDLDRIEADLPRVYGNPTEWQAGWWGTTGPALISELREARARNHKLRVWVTELTCGEAYDLERCKGCGLVGACADIAECLAEGEQ